MRIAQHVLTEAAVARTRAAWNEMMAAIPAPRLCYIAPTLIHLLRSGRQIYSAYLNAVMIPCTCTLKACGFMPRTNRWLAEALERQQGEAKEALWRMPALPLKKRRIHAQALVYMLQSRPQSTARFTDAQRGANLCAFLCKGVIVLPINSTSDNKFVLKHCDGFPRYHIDGKYGVAHIFYNLIRY